MASRSVGRALFSRTSPTSCFARQQRHFSQTTAYFKEPVPTFKPTSSPELDALLDKYRQTIFIPQSLGELHRKLMIKKSKAKQLEETPIVVKIDSETGEEFTLRNIDESEVPKRGDLIKLVKLMKTREDWQNLVPFLTGMHSSRKVVLGRDYENIVRNAGRAGAEQAAIESARQGTRTGLSLAYYDIAHQLLCAVRFKAAAANFTGPDVEVAVKQAKQVAMIMNAPEHTYPIAAEDPKRKPGIIGILLELHAARALDSYQGTDQDGAVCSTARKLIGTWSFEDLTVQKGRSAANWSLYKLVPLWHGMDLSLRVKEVKEDNELTGLLKQRMAELGDVIDATIDVVKTSKFLERESGMKIARELYTK